MILMDDVAVAVDISIFSSDLLVYANATVSQSILEFFFSVFLLLLLLILILNIIAFGRCVDGYAKVKKPFCVSNQINKQRIE